MINKHTYPVNQHQPNREDSAQKKRKKEKQDTKTVTATYSLFHIQSC